MLDVLGKRDLVLADDAAKHEDWYANIVWIDRRKCLLLTHAATLFPVFVADVRARDLRPPGPFVVQHIVAALADEDLPVDALGPLDPDGVRVARTASRQMLGFMNDATQASRWIIDEAGGLKHADLDELNRFLRRTLHNRGGYHQPLELVAERLG
jgi:hypothetical protein